MVHLEERLARISPDALGGTLRGIEKESLRIRPDGALALAVENRRIAVPFLPLACTGAAIDSGLFDAQGASECPTSATG